MGSSVTACAKARLRLFVGIHECFFVPYLQNCRVVSPRLGGEGRKKSTQPGISSSFLPWFTLSCSSSVFFPRPAGAGAPPCIPWWPSSCFQQGSDVVERGRWRVPLAQGRQPLLQVGDDRSRRLHRG